MFRVIILLLLIAVFAGCQSPRNTTVQVASYEIKPTEGAAIAGYRTYMLDYYRDTRQQSYLEIGAVKSAGKKYLIIAMVLDKRPYAGMNLFEGKQNYVMMDSAEAWGFRKRISMQIDSLMHDAPRHPGANPAKKATYYHMKTVVRDNFYIDLYYSDPAYKMDFYIDNLRCRYKIHRFREALDNFFEIQ